jgi:hypothetical protein
MHVNMRVWSGMLLVALAAVPGMPGVVNPDLSAIGQVRAGLSDDPGSPDEGDPTLALGESEIILDAYVNPFVRGRFTIAAGEEGFEMEEAFAEALRGLPWGLALKAGKYRLGFGKLNPVHPHAYPFLEPPRGWVSLMPGGEEGFNETAVQASILLPMPGDWASTLSADVLQGSSFHPDDEQTRLGWMGRWSNSFLLGERGAWEAGISGATGTDNAERDSRAYLVGADGKFKFHISGTSHVTLQGEALYRYSHGADTAAPAAAEDRWGMHAFGDWRFLTRYNAGLLYEQWDKEGDNSMTDRAVKVFTGFSVLEESTLLRLAYEYFMPDGGDGVNTLSLQFLYSMGPHKAHQF